MRDFCWNSIENGYNDGIKMKGFNKELLEVDPVGALFISVC